MRDHGSCRHAGPPEPKFEHLDPLTTRVFLAFGRLMHLQRLVMLRSVGSQGVHPREIFALMLLREHDGMSQRELASVFHLSPPRVSMILRSLEESGAIERRVDELDRRLVRVFLTPEGRRREEEQRAVFEDYVRRTLGALSEQDREELERLLTELAARTEELLRNEWTAGLAKEEGPAR